MIRSCLDRVNGARLGLVLSLGFVPSVAFSDGIDVYSYFSRLPSGLSFAKSLMIFGLIILIDYVLNFLVIGLPSLKSSGIPAKHFAGQMITLTILGQVADRLGAVFSLVFSFILTWVIGSVTGIKGGKDLSMLATFVSITNVICSGIAIGLLVSYFAKMKWNIQKNMRIKLAFAAGIFTNPLLVSNFLGSWLSRL